MLVTYKRSKGSRDDGGDDARIRHERSGCLLLNTRLHGDIVRWSPKWSHKGHAHNAAHRLLASWEFRELTFLCRFVRSHSDDPKYLTVGRRKALRENPGIFGLSISGWRDVVLR